MSNFRTRVKRSPRAVAGKRAQRAGRSAEEQVLSMAALYLQRGHAEVIKRYEPFARVSKSAAGAWRGVYAGPAGPDFEIWLPGGKAGMIEMKSRDADRIAISAIDPYQKATLARLTRGGHLALILVRLRDRWFLIEYSEWEIEYRKSHNAATLTQHGVEVLMSPEGPDYLSALHTLLLTRGG